MFSAAVVQTIWGAQLNLQHHKLRLYEVLHPPEQEQQQRHNDKAYLIENHYVLLFPLAWHCL